VEERPRLTKRQYIVNARFQLKYTAMLVLVVATVMAVLGWVIGKTASSAADYAQIATAEAEKAMKESRANSQLTRQNVLLSAADNPDLMKLIEADLDEADQKAAKDLAEVAHRKADIEARRKLVFYALGGGGGALVVVLMFMGIFITHRVVGPVHKLKRLLRRVGTGRLIVHERLRAGDELEDLFDTFLQMTWSLKALATGRLATLDATMQKAQASGASPEVIRGLRALRAQMAIGLGKVAGRSVPPPPPRAAPGSPKEAA